MTWASYPAGRCQRTSLAQSEVDSHTEGWGKGYVSERTGYVMDAFQTCSLGLELPSIGLRTAPLLEALGLPPLTRPASPFTHGSIIRSRDGKILELSAVFK